LWGLEKGSKGGLKERFAKGFINIEQDGIRDILEDILKKSLRTA